MNTRMKIMLVILALTLGYALYEFDTPTTQVRPPAPAQPAAADAGTGAGNAASQQMASVVPPPVTVDLDKWGNRDPFFRQAAPPSVETGAPLPTVDGLQLQGVQSTVDGSRKIAVISDGIYQVGDHVDGNMLKRIEDRYVVLEVNGREMKLPLKEIEQAEARPRGQRRTAEAPAGAGAEEPAATQPAALKLLNKLPMSDENRELLHRGLKMLQGGGGQP